MDVRKIKEGIESNNLPDDIIIFNCPDGDFIANMYIHKICANKGLKKVELEDSLDEIKHGVNNDIFSQFVDDSNLYVLRVDKFKETNLAAINLKNVIVICKSVEEETQTLLGSVITTLPKLQEWQLVDYTQTQLPGLSYDECKFLAHLCKGNPYRLQSEIDKIRIFNKSQQSEIFSLLQQEDGYIDLNPLTIFDLSNAILRKDKMKIKEVLEGIPYVDVEPTGLVTILLKNFKNIIDIQLTPNATPESLNINYKQFNAVKKYNCGIFNSNQLISIYKMLTSIDMKLKSGDLPNDLIIDYVISYILNE